LGLIALGALSAPAAAELLPRPEQITTPRERPALRRLAAMVTGRYAAPADPLPELDRMLGYAGEPTPLRGFIQYLRAYQLFYANRGREAGQAIDESIRLLPAYTGPLMLGASIEAFNDRPAKGVDYLLRAIALAPEDAREVDDFNLDNLVARLNQHHEGRRLELLAERLFAIGWQGDDLVLRSSIAQGLIRARVRAGDIAGARAVLPNLVLPDDARALLVMNEYRAIWPDIEAWTGPRQSRQWETYLRESGARWHASGDPETASPYVRALRRAGHYRTIVRDMLPALMRQLDRLRDYDKVWAVAPVADALAQLGRWDEAEALFAHALRIWPLGSDANALNITANQARFRLSRGDWTGALSTIEATLADVPRWGGEVSPAPLAAMHLVRACALHRLGRGDEALSSIAIVVQAASLETVIALYQCLDRPDAARAALIDALGRDGARDEAVEFAQIDETPPVPSEFGRELKERENRLRMDPAVREAVARYGRILPYSGHAGAPAEPAGGDDG
jgi:tetratricopeptide (TPR) repeat protein